MTRPAFATVTGKTCLECVHVDRAQAGRDGLTVVCGNRRSDNYEHCFGCEHPCCKDVELEGPAPG